MIEGSSELAGLLADVSADAPCGENLEFDGDFGALEREARGKPEQQYGDTIVAAEDPDWKLVSAQAAALLERTHDLRVLAHLAVARLHLRGLPGYAEILAVTRTLLETRWEAVHPTLDPEDDLDPTLRANALLRLAEPLRVVRVLRDLPLAASRRAGTVSWRDIAVTNGMIEPEDGRPKLTESEIRAAFSETEPARLDIVRGALAGALADIRGIPAAFDAQAGHGSGPDFTELEKLLRDMQRFVDRYIPAGVASAAEPPVEDVMTEADTPSYQPRAGNPETARATASSLGPITTRNDAILLLDLVRAYYESYEPSSPLPFLIDRARRLADKDFMEILRDLAPDGLSQAQNIAGNRE